MRPNAHITPVPERVPVSILERLLPSSAFATEAIAGAVGAMMMQQFLSQLRANETVGLPSFYSGVGKITIVVGVILMVSVFLCGMALLISLIRMFANNARSSPPGILLFLIGGSSLMPAFLTGLSVYLVMASVVGTPMAGVSSVATGVNILTVASIVITCLLILILGAFSFISFSSRAGRKYSPFLFLLVLEIGTICAAISFFRLFQICFSQT